MSLRRKFFSFTCRVPQFNMSPHWDFFSSLAQVQMCVIFFFSKQWSLWLSSQALASHGDLRTYAPQLAMSRGVYLSQVSTFSHLSQSVLTPDLASSTADTYSLNHYFTNQALNTVLLCFLFNPFSFIMYKGGKCLSAPESDRDCSSCVSCSCFKNVKNCQQLLVVSKMYQKMVFKPQSHFSPSSLFNNKCFLNIV